MVNREGNLSIFLYWQSHLLPFRLKVHPQNFHSPAARLRVAIILFPVPALQHVSVKFGIVSRGIPFLTDPDYFWGMAVVLSIWKSSGWWAIIFLAAIAGIDSTLYEAASIDGAGRLKRIWHITLPGIKGSIVTVLILSIGSFLGGGMVGSNFEQSFLMGNTVNNATSEIIQTYAFKMGMAQGRFSYATAVDLIQSMISIVLVIISNFVAKRISGEGLF